MSDNIKKTLLAIQAELKAPKQQYNSFGGYNYRSCEDILEAAKPLCVKHGALLTLSDEVVQVGERNYIKATATLSSLSDSESLSASANAREAENKKGMDDSQVSGATSSYARKYALNGLFCIDDEKDADTDAHTKQRNENQKKGKGSGGDKGAGVKKKELTEWQTKLLRALTEYCKGDKEEMKATLHSLTEYEKDGKVFEGKQSIYDCYDPMCQVVYGKLKAMREAL